MQLNKIFPMLVLTTLLAGCSDENVFSGTEEDFENASYDLALYEEEVARQEACRNGTSANSDSWCCKQYGYRCEYVSSSSAQSEETKCYYGTSTHTDSWCCSSYGYRCTSSSSSSYYYSSYSSSSSALTSYLKTSKTMYFALTYFYTSGDWDGLGAGDPEISFNIYAITSDGFEQKITTGTLLDKDNTKSWSGTISVTRTIPASTDTIKVCPKVVDEDVTYDDDYSSGYCYSIAHVGYLEDYAVQTQSDYKNTNCTVKWKWYLY